ncbi:MAG: uroporphyrinogen-III C-methyltransferase [Gammaproteobacteria bacterium]|nr:uroporphyrinogen-III C-methyltransferase [Gammaproteobacteria bacterium]MBU1415126.1 uroporphyrinogen-III C-methyltransferase [Gammaproteobacteria bacterium]
MTTPELPEPESAPQPKTKPERRTGAWRRPSAVIAVVALGLLGWQWLETRQRLAGVQEELARRLTDNDAIAKESRVVARNVEETQATLQAKLATLESRLAEVQAQQASFDALYRDLAKSNDERLLAEIEQGVATAAQQLRLAGNIEAALIALSAMETRLERSGQPQFAGLRQLIGRDIEQLKTLPSADVPGLTSKLESVVASVDKMPLVFERRPQQPLPEVKPAVPDAGPAEVAFWKSLGRDIWNELRQLVRVERIDASGDVPGLLTPPQSFFLRENLRLRLVNARLALLMRDDDAFHEDVRQATQWLERYFDVNAASVKSSLTTLRGLQSAGVGSDVPTLDGTLEAIRRFKLVRERK